MWCHQYRNAKAGTLEGWLWRVACAVTCMVGEEAKHERVCRAIAAIAHEQKSSVWHAWATYFNRLDQCHCYPCTKARGNDA